MSNLVGAPGGRGGGRKQKRSYTKTGTSASKTTDGRTRKLVGVRKNRKYGGLQGGK